MSYLYVKTGISVEENPLDITENQLYSFSTTIKIPRLNLPDVVVADCLASQDLASNYRMPKHART